MTRNRRLMSLLQQSGCWGNVMGFESINRTVCVMRENRRICGHFHSIVRKFRYYGTSDCRPGGVYLGYDHDTAETVEDTVAFALKNRFAFAAYNILMPYPNTPLYQQLEQENRLLFDGKWWLHPEYRFNQAAFQPANMSRKR